MNQIIQDLFSDIEDDARCAQASNTKQQTEMYLQSILHFAARLQTEVEKL